MLFWTTVIVLITALVGLATELVELVILINKSRKK